MPPSLLMDSNCTLYLVRHGETDWNARQVVQGHHDIPLNLSGEEQAKELGSRLKDIEFSAYFSSDLIRAKRTAELIALDKKIAVETTKLLREKKFGSFEGRTRKELRDREKLIAHLTQRKRFSYQLEPGMESDEQAVSRFITIAREIAVAYPGKNVLVVTHGGMMRALLIHFGVATYESASLASINNASLIKIKTDGVDFFVEETQGIGE